MTRDDIIVLVAGKMLGTMSHADPYLLSDAIREYNLTDSEIQEVIKLYLEMDLPEEKPEEQTHPIVSPYQEGFSAGFDAEMNGGDETNPYKPGTSDYKEWDRGYLDGGQDA